LLLISALSFLVSEILFTKNFEKKQNVLLPIFNDRKTSLKNIMRFRQNVTSYKFLVPIYAKRTWSRKLLRFFILVAVSKPTKERFSLNDSFLTT
jgi:hypothetical protein